MKVPVGLHDSAERVLQLELQEFQKVDSFFKDAPNWYLLYPDLKTQVQFLSGTDVRFTPQGYADRLHKGFYRLTLYLTSYESWQGKYRSKNDMALSSRHSVPCTMIKRAEVVVLGEGLRIQSEGQERKLLSYECVFLRTRDLCFILSWLILELNQVNKCKKHVLLTSINQQALTSCGLTVTVYSLSK